MGIVELCDEIGPRAAGYLVVDWALKHMVAFEHLDGAPRHLAIVGLRLEVGAARRCGDKRQC